MEYMFFGLPVVAYELTEHRVSAGTAAVFAEPNDELALAHSISEILDDPARRRAMGEAGRARVRTALSWEHSVPVLLAAYDRLWPAPRAGASSASTRGERAETALATDAVVPRPRS
jgi:glycosyltransferase involved in cell wall biosynthesis